MGGLVAFEMAQQLRQQDHTVNLLVLLDSPALLANKQVLDASTIMHLFIQELEGLFLRRIPLSLTDLQQIEEERQLNYLLEQAGKANALPPDIEQSQLRRLFTTFRMNLQALLKYTPNPYAGRLTILNARHEQSIEHEQAINAWTTLTKDVRVYNIPGTHYTLVREPVVQAVAKTLKLCLEEAQAITTSKGS